jgi:hypothetical protein
MHIADCFFNRDRQFRLFVFYLKKRIKKQGRRYSKSEISE